jgi:hypothetical protein
MARLPWGSEVSPLAAARKEKPARPIRLYEFEACPFCRYPELEGDKSTQPSQPVRMLTHALRAHNLPQHLRIICLPTPVSRLQTGS